MPRSDAAYPTSFIGLVLRVRGVPLAGEALGFGELGGEEDAHAGGVHDPEVVLRLSNPLLS